MRVGRIIFGLIALGASFAFGQSAYRTQFPLPASTSVTSWGINADINLFDPSDASLQAVQAYSASFIRVDLKWANVETVAGTYDFTYYDTLMASALNHGLRPILILDYGNPLYDSANAPADDPTRAAFVNFTTAAVTRYKGIGAIWEIWNEPNEDKFWKPAASVNDYVTLSNLVCQDIRSIAPDEWIMGPGLSGIDLPFLESCFQQGVLQYWDAVSIHPYRSLQIPETALPDYDLVKALIEKYRPAGRTIPVIDSEWGYSLSWVNMDPIAQANMDMRSKFVDMLSGARASITYSWQDQSVSQQNGHSIFGLHDANLVERASGTAFRVITTALRGYKFITRLDLASPDDYCLLFTSGNTMKLVAWTTDAAHNAVLPSSPGSFSAIDMLGNPSSASTLTPGLAVALSGSPIVLRNTTTNPLLKTASQWGRMISGSSGDPTRLSKLVGAGLVSTSWQYAPEGTALTVEDDPAPNQPFALGPTSGTLANLPTLTLSSPEVLAILQNDQRRFDMTEGARTFKVTINTPDGASATQSCQLTQSSPIRVTVLTPQSSQLTLRVDNLSAVTYSGGVKAMANGIGGDSAVSLLAGQATKPVFVPTITQSAIQSGFQMEALPSSLYAPGVATFVPAAYTALVNRMPDFGATYLATFEGDPLVLATATFSAVGAPSGAGITGMKSLKVVYAFPVGTKDIVATPPISVSNTVWPGSSQVIGLWVYGDGSLNNLDARIIDSTGQTFESSYGVINWTGWKFVTAAVNGAGATFSGGANDGVVHGQIRILSPAILVSQNTVASSGTLYFAGPTLTAIKV